MDMVYRVVETSRASNYASKAKYKMPRALKTKPSYNQCNKKINIYENFGVRFPNSNIYALIIYAINNINLWLDAITKYMY